MHEAHFVLAGPMKKELEPAIASMPLLEPINLVISVTWLKQANLHLSLLEKYSTLTSTRREIFLYKTRAIATDQSNPKQESYKHHAQPIDTSCIRACSNED